jgi:hypothetical protein
MVYKISIDSRRTNINDAISWCMEEVKSGDYICHCLFPDTSWDFNFRTEEQAVLFALKWA